MGKKDYREKCMPKKDYQERYAKEPKQSGIYIYIYISDIVIGGSTMSHYPKPLTAIYMGGPDAISVWVYNQVKSAKYFDA